MDLERDYETNLKLLQEMKLKISEKMKNNDGSDLGQRRLSDQ